jgi:hypothetical protein
MRLYLTKLNAVKINFEAIHTRPSYVYFAIRLC